MYRAHVKCGLASIIIYSYRCANICWKTHIFCFLFLHIRFTRILLVLVNIASVSNSRTLIPQLTIFPYGSDLLYNSAPILMQVRCCIFKSFHFRTVVVLPWSLPTIGADRAAGHRQFNHAHISEIVCIRISKFSLTSSHSVILQQSLHSFFAVHYNHTRRETAYQQLEHTHFIPCFELLHEHCKNTRSYK